MHTLRILLTPLGKTLSLKLDPETVVYDICRDLFSRINNHVSQPIEEFGLFVPDADPSRAYWMDNSKPVCYYPLMDKNLVLEFKCRLRRLIVRTMDDTKKTLAVDDSKTVAELILPICNKMGISNHEEYSLILELDEEERMKTMTIRRGKTQVRDFEKLEKMKQKLKTDDELNWLPHAKTLRQLGIEEKDELLLRRKYFFSDQNVDARDPVQLSLLYVQLKNAIIDGTHPVSLEESVELAGIQCQAELGNYTPDKLKSIHSNLKEYLPKEYLKTKGIDKKIIQHYEKLSGKSDKDAKVLYAQLCRSLKTYGITFFLVKEKVRAKNKLVPRLLGISKEKVMRVDEKTKEMIHSWPLTTVRRYAATASLFSLDFGDYSDENYVIQTSEGEKIAQLIAGYIDIIIKKQKASDQLINDVDEETAMIEENVAPSKANVISHNVVDRNQRNINQNNIANTAQMANRSSGMGRMTFGQVGSPQPIIVRNENKVAYGRVNAPTQKYQIRDLSQPKRAFMIRIGENLKILKAATEDLEKHIEVTKLGDDESSKIYRQQTLDVAKSKISSNLMSMSMATGNLLELTQHEDDSDDNADYSKLDTAITTIGYNTDQLLTNVHKVYEMMYDDDDQDGNSGLLLNAAKQLLNAFQDLLVAAKPIKNENDFNLANELGEEGHKFSGKSLLEAVNKVGEASRSLLQMIAVEQNQTSNTEWEARDTLLTDAKQVANSVSGMVKLAKEASIALKDTTGLESQSELIQAAKYLGQVTSMLISSAKVVACSIEQPLAQQQLLAAAKQVILSIEEVMTIVQPLLNTHEPLFQLIDQSANIVFDSVERMKQHLSCSSIIAHQDPLVAKLLSASERLPAAAGNSSEMVTQAHLLAQAGSELAECLNIAAGTREGQNLSSSSVSLDSDRQRRLMIAAQALTDAVGKLVHATKVCSKESEQSIENQQALMQAAHHMTSVAHLTAGEIIRQRVSKGLEFAGRQTAMTADQLILSSQEAAKMTRDSNYQICVDAQEMTDVVLPEVILVCSKIRENPVDAKAQNDLLGACQKLIKSLEQLLTSSEALGPRVQDVSLQSALNVSMQNSQTSLCDLKQCVQQAEIVLKPTKVANIANLEDGQLQTLQSWMDTAAESVARGVLYPLPGESVESVSAIIGNSSRNISKNLDNMYDTLSSMNIDFSDNDNSNNLQSDLVKKAKELMDSMEKLLRGTRGMAALKSKSGSEDTVYDKQIDIINSGKQVVRSGEDVIHGVKLASVGALSLEELKQSIEKMKDDIDVIVHHIPSYQEIESLVEKLKSSMTTFEDNCVSSKPPSTPAQNKSHLQLQSEFTAAVAIFNQTLGDLMNTNCSHLALTSLANQLNDSHACMLDSGAELIHQSPGKEDELMNGLKSVSDNTSCLLDQLKDIFVSSGVSSDVNILKQSLLRAAGLVSESMNGLLSACAGTLPPSQQQCDRSQRQIEALKTGILAEPPSMALNSQTYAQCMQLVDEHYQNITSQIRRIPISCKSGDSNDFCLAVQKLASSTIEMLKATTQANFQLGVIQSDQSLDSLSQRSPLLEAMFDQAKSIKENCTNIISEDITELQCREQANEVRMRVSSACQLVKECISNSKDRDHQNLLLEAGKRLAEATATLLKTINSTAKSVSKSDGEVSCDEWSLAAEGVCGTVDNLMRVAMRSNTENQYVTEQGKQSQTSIYQASVEVAEGSFTLIRAAGALVKDSKSIPANQAFIINQKTFDNALCRLNNIIKYSAPGQREFMEIEEEIKHLLRNLDRINMDNVSQNKIGKNTSRTEDSVSNDIQRMQSSLKHLRNKIPVIETVLMNVDKLEYMGRSTEHAANYLAPITESTTNLVTSLPHSRDRGEILELTKTVLEAFLVTVQECQNMSSENNLRNVQEQVSCLKEGCEDLSRFVDSIANSHGTVESMITSMQNSMAKLNNMPSDNAADVALAHTNIVQSAKAITETLNDIVGREVNVSRLQKKESTKKIKTLDESQIIGHKKQADLHSPVKRLVNEYESLVLSSISISKNKDDKLIKSVLSIGQSCMDLIRYEQPEYATQVRSRLADLLFALQSSAKGTQCCIAAANQVSQMVAELDTAIMFASSGSLNLALSDSDQMKTKLGSVSDMKEEIFKITRSLVSDLQQMIYSVDGKQESLVMAIDNAVKRADQLCKAVKSSAIVLGIKPSLLGLVEGSEECFSAQTLLLNAVRDVAVALVDFFNCTKTNVSATEDKEGERAKLKNSLQTMVTSVDGLIKSVKSLEESGLRGTRALEAALEAMRKELNIIEMWDHELNNISKIPEAEDKKSKFLSSTDIVTASSSSIYTAENLVTMSKPLLNASQKAMIAAQTFKQEDILIAANVGRKAIQDFSLYMKATVALRLQQEKEKPSHIFKDIAMVSSNPDRRSTESVQDTCTKVVEHGKGAVKALIDMYENLNKGINEGSKDGPCKMQMKLASRRVAHSIHEVNEAVVQLKGSPLVEANDSAHIAEEELLEAASQIEAAAKKLALLRPRKSDKKEKSEEDTFDGQIINACGSIVSATGHLVRMATECQQELVTQGRLKASGDISDQTETQWSHGLISAARLVSAATENLCDSAKEVVQGKCGSERLISASKQVAAGTAHLLLACQVKSDADSQSNQRLQAAGAAVKRATEALVKEASEDRDDVEGSLIHSYGTTNKSMVTSMRNVIQAQADIVAKEKELEKLRNKYQTIRQEQINTHPELYNEDREDK